MGHSNTDCNVIIILTFGIFVFINYYTTLVELFKYGHRYA